MGSNKTEELKMRILLVEDDKNLARDIPFVLEAKSFHVDEADRAEDALHLTSSYNYEAIILDLNLPDMRGDEVLMNLRKKKNLTPVLVMSSENAIEARLSCFEQGANDYLIKPFHARELVARMHALVRRSNGHAESVLKFGDLELNLLSRMVSVGGMPLNLTRKEYEMLELLCLRQGSIVTKEHFLDHLYGGMDEPETKIIDVFICKLRKKMAHSKAAESLIKTVWGRGYRIDKMEAAA
jgi:two-component system cell cycle response regulator CtrA